MMDFRIADVFTDRLARLTERAEGRTGRGFELIS